MNRPNALLLFICLSTVFLIAHFVDRGKIMTPEISTPYFSGAALLGKNDDWKFNLNEVDSLKKLIAIPDRQERIHALDHFRFSSSNDSTKVYHVNQPGLLYAIRLSQFIFPFYGAIGSLKMLQLLLHCIFSFLILRSFTDRRKQLAFFLLYTINPFIIYLCLFPFYYYWQTINAYLAILLLQNKKSQTNATIFFCALLFAFLYHIRVSTITLSIFILLFCFHRLSYFIRAGALLFMFGSIYLLNPTYLSKHPGHVMYSSLGAYPNSPVSGFSDNISFNDYNQATGNQFSYESSPSMYDAEVIMGEAKWGYEKFMEFAKTHPFIIIRNACLNFCESFSAGYLTASLALTYLSAMAGFLFLCILIYRKKFEYVFLISASAISYILYLAPVPIYLFGSYVLLVFVFVQVFFKEKLQK